MQVATAVADAIGADRVGFRISPANPFNDIAEEEVEELYTALRRRHSPHSTWRYLHLVESTRTAT